MLLEKSLSDDELLEYQGNDRVVSSYEIQESLKLKRQGNEPLTITSGIPTLDRYTEGFREGELVIVSGPTGEGKTLLMQTITHHITNKDEPVMPIWFSFEMPPAHFLRCFPDVPYFYMPLELKPYKWQWFYNRCRENELKHQSRIIIIDHLHFLLDFFKSGNPSIEIGGVVRKLKRLSVDRRYIIFLVAHIRMIADGTKASLRHIRDSSFVTQEADTVIMIQRYVSEKKENQAELTVDKCRWTGTMGKKVFVKKIDGYLRELTDDFSA